MKNLNNLSVKLMLLGISFMVFSTYSNNVNGGGESIFEGIIAVLGAFLPIIGLIICIIAMFIKK